MFGALLISLYIILISMIVVLLYKNKAYRNRIAGRITTTILKPEELEKHAREIALSHSISSKSRSCLRLLPRMEENYKFVIKAYKELNSDTIIGEPIIPAAEWLFDNFYIIEEQVREIRLNFPKGYYAVLPCLTCGLLKGFPRIYDIALELVYHTDGRIDENLVTDFIRAYQSKSQLTSGEIWGLSIMLKIALLENIRHICECALESQRERREADRLADIILSSENENNVIYSIKSFTKDMDTLSPSFSEQFLKRVRRHGTELGPIMHYIDEKLASQDTTAEDIISAEHQDQAQKQVSIGNSITSLRLISSLDWNNIFESISPVEQVLNMDPSSVYSSMDFTSRDYYRHIIEDISRALKVSEAQVARKAIEFAEKACSDSDICKMHVGYYIAGNGRPRLEHMLGYRPAFKDIIIRFLKHHPSRVYITSIVLMTLIITGAFVFYGVITDNRALIPFLIIFAVILPVSDISISLINWIIIHILPPSFLPKLELKDGIPKELSSMVVIPALLPNKARIMGLLQELEVYYLANQEDNLYFALLGDFTDAGDKDMPEDESLVKCALDGIRSLNHKYSNKGSDIFYFFHRFRKFNPSQGIWMGWERKRGKLMEFNELLRGADDTSYYIKSGDIQKLPVIKYVITLDADTELPRSIARRLIGTISHPLNKAVVNSEKSRVVQGYGVLQPRISIGITNANKSRFSRIFAGQGGIDPYTTAVSDIYQDLFSEGIFTGKGILDVDVFLKCLDGYIPENSVLSHDLLEGSYVRTGLVTDIEFVDGFPWKYSAYMARLHRWIRGDWQLLPWLSSSVRDSRGEYVKNPLSPISKWKIFDNLRRSLIPLSLVVLLLLSFTLLPGSELVWLVLTGVTIVFPIFTDMIDAVFAKSKDKTGSYGVLSGLRNALYQVVLMFMFLPYRAYVMLDAILRTLVRLWFTKRNMLEWETAADAEIRLRNDFKSYIVRMWISQVLALALTVLALLYSPWLYLISLTISVLWFISPAAAYLVSQADVREGNILSEEDIHDVRLISRKIWRYFEEFAGPAENYLPPDNFQEDPPNGIAHRTSPTNMGLGLMAVLAARDMGYINTSFMIERIEHIFSSMDKLDTWKGHFYNWYDTITLQPLRPLYVSAVDSGNLAGYLMVLKEGIREYLSRPLIGKELVMGLIDSAELLNEDMEEIGGKLDLSIFKVSEIDPIKWDILLDNVKSHKDEVNKDGHLDRSLYSKKLDEVISSHKEELALIIPWLELLKEMPFELKDMDGFSISRVFDSFKLDTSLTGLCRYYRDCLRKIKELSTSISESCVEGAGWMKELKLSVMNAYLAVNRELSRSKLLIERCTRLIEDMDFKPLFDERRQLFSIGYSAEDEQLNRSYYDLLASESRQTSFIAVAKGDIDQKHWFKLGRSLTFFDKYKGLVSWSGTMFEYLMPLLIMKNYKNTLLDSTYNFVLKSQISYGHMRNVPWGVSESGFYAFDMNFNYQYRAFGVPRLGLKRGLVNDMVVAPYASILALMVDPYSAMKNISFLKSEGMDGPYGLYEACDFTPERIPVGKKRMIVKSYMVHHHGMSLMALDNILNKNIMQERFHNDPHVKATELLLQEKVPGKVMLAKDIEDEVTPPDKEEVKGEEYIREIRKPSLKYPEAHIISNGTYYTLLTSSGSGYSRLGETAISRWREDAAFDNYGIFLYIKNVNSNNVWSAAYEPYKVMPEDYKVTFSSDKVDYFRVDGSIDTHTEVVVSPEDNCEIRRISLTNHSNHSRVLEVTSYFELVLSSQSADLAHPAFNNLFVKTKFIPSVNSLVAVRRQRTPDEKTQWLVHKAIVEGEAAGSIQYETDRSKFIGRNRDVTNPAAEDVDHPLSNSSGAVLDPIMSLRRRVKIGTGETVRVSFITGSATSKEDVLDIASKYNDLAAVKRAFELAWTRSQVESNFLNLKSRDIELFQRMISSLIYLNPQRRMRADVIGKNNRGQSGLWPYGISGDLPIVLVIVGKSDETDIVYQMLKAHEYWRIRGLKVDLCILAEDSGDYMQDLQNKVRNMILSSHAADIQDRPGGVFLRQSSMMTEEGRDLILSAARLVLRGDGGTIWQQLKSAVSDTELSGMLKKNPSHFVYQEPLEEIAEMQFFNGLGGFSMDGSEYVIRLNSGQNTPAPWINVICNRNFGFIVSESGAGYTWAENSRENKLTTWSNDPVTNLPGEVIYFRDEEDGSVWSPTSMPVREENQYTIRHGFGYSVFEHSSHGIKQEVTMFVPDDTNVKIMKVRLKNFSGRSRKLSAVYYIRPVLGVSDQITAPFIITDADDDSGVALIKNSYSDDFPGRCVFMDCSIKERSMTGDRREFIGTGGSLSSPEGLEREKLSGRMGPGYDPCCAIQVKFEFKGNEERIISFTLGQGMSDKDAVLNALKYRDLYEVEKALNKIRGYWKKVLGTIKVKTPDASLDIIANGWLLYQTICCRLWARSAFYQSGGAYGFRDQLQDSLAALYVLPDLTRVQLLTSASHQYLEGDVQHWWHPFTDKGIRTKFSDDLLWLPYVTQDYIEVTKDTGVLDEAVPYIEDEPLGETEDERYNKPRVSMTSGSLYEHCIRAIDRSLKFGVHGIPLMGSGDWNDGMNTVGNKGKGESIWLGWFLYSILIKFAPICRLKGDNAKGDEYLQNAQNIIDSIEKNGWDGSWYRRAYFDDGTPLGSALNAECQIDSLSQSWSIISGGGREKRAAEAMGALEHYLINRDAGLIKLLTPPFNSSELEPGYIKGYVPGVRENGGQYTHAAVWVIMAFAISGRGDKALELFHMINPINHALTPIEYSRYRVEPYVMAADVYAVGHHTGRGGWTWYTGAAGWMYRVCIEHMLGLKPRGNELLIEPCIPEKWKEYTIKYMYFDTRYIIDIKNPSGVSEGVAEIHLDGRLLNEKAVPLVNDKMEHRVEVILG